MVASYLRLASRGGRFTSMQRRVRGLAEETRKEYHARAGKRDIRMAFEFGAAAIDAGQDQEAVTLGTGASANGSRTSGIETFRTLLSAIETINEYSPYTFSPQQMEIIKLILQCALKQIFSESELMSQLRYIIRFFDSIELFQDLIVEMARRQGKTTVLSCSIAMLLLSLQAANTNCFSSGSRVSSEMKKVVTDIIDVLIKYNGRFHHCGKLVNNKERLAVRSIHGTVNIFNGYPCNESTLSSPRPYFMHSIPFCFSFFFLRCADWSSLSMPRSQKSIRQRNAIGQPEMRSALFKIKIKMAVIARRV